ncbi:MAG: OmpH family outer membrane protein [Alphaproteobacteria bacterium]
MPLRRSTLISFLAVAMVTAGPSIAQQQQPQRQAPAAPAAQARALPAPIIGIIDVEAILREASAVKSVRAQLETISGKMQEDLNKEEDRLRARETELQQQRALLTPEVFAQKRQEFQRDALAFQQRARNARQIVDQGFREAMGRIELVLLDEVSKLAEERGINLVLRRNQVAVAREEYDISAAALERLNKRQPDVKLTLEQGPRPGAQQGQPQQGQPQRQQQQPQQQQPRR